MIVADLLFLPREQSRPHGTSRGSRHASSGGGTARRMSTSTSTATPRCGQGWGSAAAPIDRTSWWLPERAQPPPHLRRRSSEWWSWKQGH